MIIDLIKLPEPPNSQTEERVFREIKVEGLTYVPGIDDLLGKELSIVELSQRLQQLFEAGGEANEPVEIGPITPYVLSGAGQFTEQDFFATLSPVLALRLVIDAIKERHGTSGYQVRLR
jgi:hypothetical protein